MSAPAPLAGPSGAARWVIVAGVSVSLHLAAVSAMTLALAGQPQAPSAAAAGIVIRTLAPVIGTTAEPGRAQATAATDRLRALDEATRTARDDPAATRPPPR
jgi:hypothetical protein